MKVNSYFFLGLVSLLLAATCSYAQLTAIETGARHSPSSGYIPPKDSADKQGKASQSEINLAAMINLYTHIDTTTGKVRSFGSNIQARYTSFSRDGYNKLILPAELYCFNVGLFYYKTINKKWAYNIFVNTALNSDLQQVDKNDVFITGGAVFLRRFTPNFSLGIGAILHNNLGSFMPWPALTVDWKMGSKFKLDIRTPDKAPGIAHYVGISYAANSMWNFSFAFQPELLSYDVTTTGKINNRLMSFWQLPFTFSPAFRTGNLEVMPRIGLTALRSYAYGEKKTDKMFTKYPYHGLGANLTIGIGLKLSLFPKKS